MNKSADPQKTADLFTCTKKIFNRKLHFLYIDWYLPNRGKLHLLCIEYSYNYKSIYFFVTRGEMKKFSNEQQQNNFARTFKIKALIRHFQKYLSNTLGFFI